MKEWYLRQSPRDRLIVIALGTLTLIGLLYAFLWFPLSSKIDSQRSAIASKTEDLVYLEKGAAQIKQLGSGGGTIKESNLDSLQLINQVITKADAGRPDRLDPVNDKKTRIQFSNVAFDKLVGVIAELETYNVVIDTANLTRKKETGYVSARLTMVRQ